MSYLARGKLDEQHHVVIFLGAKLFAFFALALFCIVRPAHAAVQLTYGKYFGSIQMDGRSEQIAVSLDAFVVQIKDPTVYPALEILLRVNLGGYTSSEYVGYRYYNPTFNFEKGVLQLGDPKSDLTATLQVTNTEEGTIIEGPITHRLSGVHGRMRVVMKSDDSDGDVSASKDLEKPFLSTLKGDYLGHCGSDRAELQIETGRGLGDATPGNALLGYSITGRFGLTNGPLCYPDRSSAFCSLYILSAGTYSPFNNRLTLQGPLGSLECSKSGDQLTCQVAGYHKNGSCQLKKASLAATPPRQSPATVILEVESRGKSLLPPAAPPENRELIEALSGDFYGFLHHEANDIDQLMELNVVATTSTENMHIQNQVNVEPTIHLRLGSSWEARPALSLFFSQRVFGLNQGFSFQNGDGDYEVVIGEWRAGYISGVLYSRSFGRVGSFELQKSVRPALDPALKFAPDPTGAYRTERGTPTSFLPSWTLNIELPNQTSAGSVSGIPLLARFGGPGVMTVFDAASLDLNSLNLSFLIKKSAGDRLVTGDMVPGGKLKLLWPVGPALGSPMGRYEPYLFERTRSR